MGLKGKAKGGGSDEEKIEKIACWLSDKVFAGRRIDDEAVAAMQGMGIARAMELFREIEEKADQVKNPSGYLKSAARREGFGPQLDGWEERGWAGKGGQAGTDPGKVAKRVRWLNANVFAENPIDDRALESMQGVAAPRAMEILKELEGKAEAGVRNPSSYLRTASNREKERAGLALAVSAPPARHAGKGGGAGGAGEHDKIERRAAWLNRKLFQASPIDGEAVAAMKGMGAARAMELFREVEEKEARNPSGYLKRAAAREGFGPPGQPPPREAAGKGGAGKGGASREAQRVQKRVDWLNKHSFTSNPIDDDAVAVMLEVDVPRAMEIFKELEAKGGEVHNPSAYLISAVKKGPGGAKRKAPQDARPAPGKGEAPAKKRAKAEAA